MGGSAFSKGPDALWTPRMPPAVYHKIHLWCRERLQQHFSLVVTPTEAPEKKSHGDIDFLVLGPKAEQWGQDVGADKVNEQRHLPEPLAAISALGAEKHIYNGPNALSLAIPWPADLAHFLPDDTSRPESSSFPQRAFIQVDVRACSSRRELEWAAFKHAHGDVWQILGVMMRPLGLTASEHALYVRVPDLELVNKKQARVFLTDSPEETARFLGLDSRQWDEPFATVQDLFEFVARCRFFDLDAATVVGAESEAAESRESDSPPTKTTHNDRSRFKNRPVFRRFFYEYVPSLNAKASYPGAKTADRHHWTRDEVTREALATFPHAKPKWEAALAAYRREESEKWLTRPTILDMLPPAEAWPGLEAPGGGAPAGADQEKKARNIADLKRDLVAGAFRRVVLKGDKSYDSHLGWDTAGLRDGDGSLVAEAVRGFVAEWHQRLGARAWEEHNGKYTTTKMKEKAVSAGAT